MGIYEKVATKSEVAMRMDIVYEILDTLVHKDLVGLSEQRRDELAEILIKARDFRINIRRDMIKDLNDRIKEAEEEKLAKEKEQEIEKLDKEIGDETN